MVLGILVDFVLTKKLKNDIVPLTILIGINFKKNLTLPVFMYGFLAGNLRPGCGANITDSWSSTSTGYLSV